MELLIKNMVCERCKRVVRAELRQLGYTPLRVDLGSVSILESVEGTALAQLSAMLEANGFELISNRKAALVNDIKQLIMSTIRNPPLHKQTPPLSDWLARRMGYDYTYLSSLFSTSEGMTIERYAIAQKIELAKEWLLYDEMSLTDIADQLQYSSVQHLSTQFKQLTGLSPTAFKKRQAVELRQGLDQISIRTPLSIK